MLKFLSSISKYTKRYGTIIALAIFLSQSFVVALAGNIESQELKTINIRSNIVDLDLGKIYQNSATSLKLSPNKDDYIIRIKVPKTLESAVRDADFIKANRLGNYLSLSNLRVHPMRKKLKEDENYKYFYLRAISKERNTAHTVKVDFYKTDEKKNKKFIESLALNIHIDGKNNTCKDYHKQICGLKVLSPSCDSTKGQDIKCDLKPVVRFETFPNICDAEAEGFHIVNMNPCDNHSGLFL